MPLRLFRVRLVLCLTALLLCPQVAAAQEPPPSAWSVGGSVGLSYAGGDGARVMRSPSLVSFSIQRRIADSPWWVGIEALRLRARPTSAGMDTLMAHAPSYLTGAQAGRYETGIVEGLVRYDVPSHGVLATYALAGMGISTTTGFICNASECAAGDSDRTGWNAEYRRATMIGGGVSLWFPKASSRAIKLYGEVRLVNVSTRHGGMFVTPVLLGASLW